MNLSRRTVGNIAGAFAIVGTIGIAGGILGPDASAETSPPPTVLAVGPITAPPTTTVDCPDCDNANSGIGTTPGLTFSWACELDANGQMTGVGRHVAIARVPKGWAGPVTFNFPAATPATVVVAPGHQATMIIRAPSTIDVYWVGRIFGPGVNRNVNQGPFNCPCGLVTTSTSSPTTTIPPVGSTTPGTPTTLGTPSTVPGAPTTAPVVRGTLPATGGGGTAAYLGVIMLAVAVFLLYAARHGQPKADA